MSAMPSTIGQTLSKPSKQNGKQNDTATLQDTAYIYYHWHVLNSLTPQEQNFCFEAFESKKGDTLQTAAYKPHGGISLYWDILANVLGTGVDTNPTSASHSVSESEPAALNNSISEGKDTTNSDTKQDIERKVDKKVEKRD